MKNILQKHNTIKYIFLAVSGILTCLPLVFTSLGFLQWVSMSLFAIVIISEADGEVRYKAFYKYGFVYFMCFYLTAFHWFVNLYPLSFVEGMTKGAAAVVVALAWVGLSLLQTLLSAFVPVLIALLARRGLCKRHKMLLPIGAASIYVVFEWMQTLTWAGVPWARLAIGQTAASAMIKTASLFGSYFISFLIVLVGFYIAMAMLFANKRRLSLVICATVVVANAATGSILMLTERNDGKRIKAAALQLNVSSQEKWWGDLDLIKGRLEKYALMAAEEGAELIVASESVLPIDVIKGGGTYEFLRELARKCNATLIVGCFTEAEGGSKNSLLLIDPEGNVSDTVYSKRHLVPFGEYVPMRDIIEALVPPLADISMLGEDIIAGEGTEIYDTELGKIGSLICFDSIYENLTLRTVRDGADLIVLSTNDSWFLDSAALRMHNAQAMLRAVESGRYIVRSANTGISSIISPNGEMLDSEGALVEGYAIADIYTSDSITLYSVVGNLIVWLSAGFVIFLITDIKKILTKC